KLIDSDEMRWNSQSFRHNQLGTRTMRDSQIRLFLQDSWHQLERAKTQPHQLADFVLPGVTSDQLAVQMKKVRQFVHLKTVARGEHHRITALLKFVDDWRKKWHMGGIIQVDPDLFFVAKNGCTGCSRCGR